MDATGTSCAEMEFSPEERHAETAAILAAGLARIVKDGQCLPAENTSESGEKRPWAFRQNEAQCA